MESVAPRGPRAHRVRSFGWLVLGMSMLGVAFLGLQHLDRMERERAERRALAQEQQALLRLDQLGDELGLLAAGLGGAGFERSDFERAAKTWMRVQPSAKRLTWVPHVRSADRDVYVADARNAEPGFDIWQRAEDGDRISAPFRFHYFPERWTWPVRDPLWPMGYDLGVEERERLVLIDAMVAGGPIRLDQGDSRWATLVHPVYEGDVPDEVAERRATLRGFLIGELELGPSLLVASI